jgi:tyrosine aminotransferase
MVSAQRSHVLNPIRQLLEKDLKPDPNHVLPLINLGLGEPTKANGYDVPASISEALIEAVESEKANSYTLASGTVAAKEAIAERFGTPEAPIDPKNVFLSFGTYGALYNCVSVMCERGDHILVPRPGFPFYQPICQNLGVNFSHFDLDSEKEWQVDLEHLRS